MQNTRPLLSLLAAALLLTVLPFLTAFLALPCSVRAAGTPGEGLSRARAAEEAREKAEAERDAMRKDRDRLQRELDRLRRSQGQGRPGGTVSGGQGRGSGRSGATTTGGKGRGQGRSGAAASGGTRPPLSASKTHTNSIGMEFVLIPAGTFKMGCGSSEQRCNYMSDDMPRHTVTISRPFYLGKYEVTQAQWESVMGNNPSEFKGSNRPVENVSWHDVQEFIRKLNAKEGHTRYRLPTEAEWEYAARAGSATAYSFGNDASQLGNYAWYSANAGDETHPVGQKRANGWGLYDMHGNVWEWVQDWYDDGYSAGAVTDPQGPNAGGGRVLRGGSWNDVARGCRSARRVRLTPDLHFGDRGVRLAFSLGH